MTAALHHPGDGGMAAPEHDDGRPRVIVGVDGSPGSRAALAHALVAAARRGADVEVVSSYGVTPYYYGGGSLDLPDVPGVREDQQARARALVSEVQGELAISYAPGISDLGVTSYVSAGPAAQTLLERSAGADLLVVGSRGRGPIRSVLLGSVALHCVTHAACPVVVVHGTVDVEPPQQVVVGVDGSAESGAALSAAIEEAGRTGAAVEAVATYQPADYWTDFGSVVVPSVEQIRRELDGRTRALVDGMLAARSTTGGAAPTVRVEVAEGPASDVLLARARTATLLVLGSRGRGSFRGLLLGSVALRCAMHAPCPVMVVHPQRSGTAGGKRFQPAMAGH
jgi:nucleotide-binding universal stress UspA family protein